MSSWAIHAAGRGSFNDRNTVNSAIGASCIATIALLLPGCALDMDIPNVTPDRPEGAVAIALEYPDELDEAMTAWRMLIGEPRGCDPARVYVAHVAGECMGIPRPGGCILVHSSPLWEHDAYTIVIEDEAIASAVVSRELRMWLHECSDYMGTAHATTATPQGAAE